MSEKQKPLEYYGPKPGPLNEIFTGLLVSPSGNIGAEFHSQVFPELNPMEIHELACYEDMQKSNEWVRDLKNVPESSPDYAKAQEKIELLAVNATIQHYALSCIQASKLERGLKLDAPLTPHPDVHWMNLQKPAAVPTLEA